MTKTNKNVLPCFCEKHKTNKNESTPFCRAFFKSTIEPIDGNIVAHHCPDDVFISTNEDKDIVGIYSNKHSYQELEHIAKNIMKEIKKRDERILKEYADRMWYENIIKTLENIPVIINNDD